MDSPYDDPEVDRAELYEQEVGEEAARIDTMGDSDDSRTATTAADISSQATVCKACNGHGRVEMITRGLPGDAWIEFEPCPACQSRRADDDYFKFGSRYPGQ